MRNSIIASLATTMLLTLASAVAHADRADGPSMTSQPEMVVFTEPMVIVGHVSHQARHAPAPQRHEAASSRRAIH